MDPGRDSQQPLEAVIYPDGRVVLLSPVHPSDTRRALVTILDEPPAEVPTRTFEFSLRDLTGDRISGAHVLPARYRITRKIASGGMGTTFEAEDLMHGRCVCVKTLHSSIVVNSLLQEATSLTRLDHPNIVRIIDYGVESEGPFLVMEFIHGSTLRDYLRSNEQRPVRHAFYFARSLFSAIGYAHQQGIIHCDLKPGNVLLEPTVGPDGLMHGYTLKVVDFGLAIVDTIDVYGGDTLTLHPAGTLTYMAPEQIQGHRLTEKCDIYALGVILWEMCSSKRPFFSGANWTITYQEKRDGPLRLALKQAYSRPRFGHPLVEIEGAPPSRRAQFGLTRELTLSLFMVANFLG